MNSNPVLRKEVMGMITPLCTASCLLDKHRLGTQEYKECYNKCSSETYATAENLYRYRPYSPYYANILSPHYKKIDTVIMLIFIFALIYYYFIKK